MSKEVLKAQIELLLWFIKLTGSGMTVGMIRYRLLKKHEELEKEMSDSELSDISNRDMKY